MVFIKILPLFHLSLFLWWYILSSSYLIWVTLWRGVKPFKNYLYSIFRFFSGGTNSPVSIWSSIWSRLRRYAWWFSNILPPHLSPHQWQMGTHMRVFSESYPMSTSMTRIRCFSKKNSYLFSIFHLSLLLRAVWTPIRIWSESPFKRNYY